MCWTEKAPSPKHSALNFHGHMINLELFGSSEQQYVWRQGGQCAYCQSCRWRIMLWGCFADRRAALKTLSGIMKKNDRPQMKRSLDLGCSWLFQQDNDPKHTSKVMTKRLRQAGINTLECTSQISDLNPTRTCRTSCTHVFVRKPTDVVELHRFIQEVWLKKSSRRSRLTES